MLEEIETALLFEVRKILQPTRLEIVEREDAHAVRDQPIDEVRSDEARAAGNQHGPVGKSRERSSVAAGDRNFVDVSL